MWDVIYLNNVVYNSPQRFKNACGTTACPLKTKNRETLLKLHQIMGVPTLCTDVRIGLY
jgi:hypothetical protein